MTVRVEVVTPCDHDDDGQHTTEACWAHDGKHDIQPDCYCDGNDRRTFTEWPPEAIEAAANELIRRQFLGATPKAIDQLVESYSDKEPFIEDAKAALVAAWGHITGDNK